MSDCIDCLERSNTNNSVGMSTWQSCLCEDIYYRLKWDEATDECQVCPTGLRCHGDDTLDPVVAGSNWVRDGKIFRLVDCPFGYSVENGGDGVFSAEIQRCEPCDKGEYLCVLALSLRL